MKFFGLFPRRPRKQTSDYTSTFGMEITPILVVDIIGLVIGFISIFIIQRLRETIGGRLGRALNLFVWGVVAMTVAFGWEIFSVVFPHPLPADEIQRLLMIAGMTLFVLSARKFFSLMQL